MDTTALARSVAADATTAGPARGAVADLRVARPRWLTTYTAVLVVLDGTAMAAATLTAKISWLGINPDELHIRSFSIPYAAMIMATVPAWLVILALAGAYDLGPFGVSRGVWTHIVRAGAQLLAVVAVAYYILHLATLGRGVLAGLIPLAVALTLAGRALAGTALDELRRRGHARRSALVVGSRASVDAFVHQVETHPASGLTIVATSVIDHEGDDTSRRDATPGDGARNGEATESSGRADGAAGHASNGTGGGNGHNGVADGSGTEAPAGPAAVSGPAWQPPPLLVSDALARTRAETLIVTGGLAHGQLRDIAWTLEGTGVELLVTHTPADIEGLRSEIRPVAGLPLLYLDR